MFRYLLLGVACVSLSACIALTVWGLGLAPRLETAATDIILVCNGHMFQQHLNVPTRPTRHEIVIHGATADVDGKPFVVNENATSYYLMGPPPARTATVSIVISRLEGMWILMTGDPTKDEDSIQAGDGCHTQSPQF